MLFGSKKVIGLDIGSTTIKVAELDVGRKASKLVSFGIIPTPPQAMSAGDILDTQSLAAAVAQVMAEVKIKKKQMASGLWGSSVIVKRISIPQMEESLVSEQIRWEAEQYIPYDINEVTLDYKILKNTISGSSETMDILLIAAVQEMTLKYAEVIALAGLDCSVLDVEGFALANCFEHNYGTMPGQVIAILNIGASVTNFVIVDNGEVIFCRDVPVGGLTYTGELQKSLGVSYEEAEDIKFSASSGGAVPEEANSVIEGAHDIVMDEISGSFEFFLNTADVAEVKQVFISGGGSLLPGLMERLERKFSGCQRFDPFHKVSYNQKVFSADYIHQIRDMSAVVLGLALRKLGDS